MEQKIMLLEWLRSSFPNLVTYAAYAVLSLFLFILWWPLLRLRLLYVMSLLQTSIEYPASPPAAGRKQSSLRRGGVRRSPAAARQRTARAAATDPSSATVTKIIKRVEDTTKNKLSNAAADADDADDYEYDDGPTHLYVLIHGLVGLYNLNPS